MRLVLPLAALLFGALATPAFAQQFTEEEVNAATSAIETAELSDEAYQNMWCTAAFGIIKELATKNNMAEDAASAEKFQDVVINKALAELIPAGVSEADFTALSQNFYVVALSQTGEDAEADYTLDDCTAAAQP